MSQSQVQRSELTVSASSLRTALAPLANIADEVKLEFEDDHILGSAVDPANVKMAEIEIDADLFESYVGMETVIGLNIDEFQANLGAVTNHPENDNPMITIGFDEENAKLELESDTVSFEQGFLDPDILRTSPDREGIVYTSNAVLNESWLSHLISTCGVVDDVIRFEGNTNDSSLTVMAEGDTTSTEITVSDDDFDEFEPDDFVAMFKLEHLKALVDSVPTSESVALSFGDEFPIRLEYELADDNVAVDALVAPRVTTD